MLVNLYVKNMALIEEADISFKEGLNIITGETGAGKSIIIGSVNIVLGSKVTAGIIRKGAEYALAELTFQVKDKKKLRELKDMDIEILNGGDIVISRKITENRNVIKVNGEAVTAAQIKKIAGILIDIHGQQEHQSLLNESKHLEFIDVFADNEIAELKSILQEEYEKYQGLRKEISKMTDDEEMRRREISFLEFEINEIQNAGLKENEDIELEITYKKMINSQKIINEISQAACYIGQNGYETASDLVGKAVRCISSVSGYDEELQSVLEQLYDAESILNDISYDLTHYMQTSEFDNEIFENVQNRLNELNHLKMKYGKSVSDILTYKEEKEKKLLFYRNFEEEKERLLHELEKTENNMEKYSSQLSMYRKEFAQLLSEKIKKALHELNFLEVRFEVAFERLQNYTANGYDSARFLISANPGEDIKPLAKIASGGEMSRIMLAIKTVLADKDNTDTLIFDEIDSGISGKTAQMVANKLNEIAKTHQILCITHLPQIAAMADTHFLIEKTIRNNMTITQMKELNESECIHELARLLGGVRITDAVYSNASEMKKLAKQLK